MDGLGTGIMDFFRKRVKGGGMHFFVGIYKPGITLCEDGIDETDSGVYWRTGNACCA